MCAVTGGYDARAGGAALPMLTSRIALVPFDGVEPAGVDPKDVAVALGEQITRDVQPAWHVSATVEYVPNFDDLPEDCVPLVIIEDDERLPGHGFHFDIAGRPCALIRNTDGRWSQFASHELIELLCDPTGALTVPGETLDTKKRPQTVNYLIEVCDPVEESTYEGKRRILVSDFVYPAYYVRDEDVKPDMRYSHCETIPAPRRLLTGGYLSWQTLDTGKVFQAFGGPAGGDAQDSSSGDADPSGTDQPVPWPGDPRITELRPGADLSRARSRINRHWVGMNRKGPKGKAVATERTPSSSSGPDPRKAERPHVQALREEIQTFIDLVTGRRPPPVSLEDLVRALEAYRVGGPAPYRVLQGLGAIYEVPDGEERQVIIDDVIEALRSQEKIAKLFGEGLFGSGISSWVLYLMP